MNTGHFFAGFTSRRKTLAYALLNIETMAYPEKDPAESNREDEALVAQVLAGHPQAFKQIKEKYHEAMRHFIQHMVRDKADVDLPVAGVFGRAFLTLSSYPRRTAFSTWLYRLALNYTLDRLRKNQTGA